MSAAASSSAAQPPPSIETRPASGESSRPSARRNISAPESCCLVLALRERFGGGLQVDLIERDPTPAGTNQRTRFLREPRDVGRGELDVVEHRRPAARSRAGWRRRPYPKRRRRRRAATANSCACEICGARTSKPAATSCGPVFAMRSHASSALRMTWPRRSPPGRSNTGSMRSRRAISASRCARSDVDAAIACSTEIGPPRDRGTFTATRHAPPSSGGSSCTISRSCGSVTSRAQRSMPRHDLARDLHRRVERAAVEPGEERFGDIVARADARRRRGYFDPSRAVAADRVDHSGQRRTCERARVDVAIEDADAPGHVLRPCVRGALVRRARASSAPRTSRWPRWCSGCGGCAAAAAAPSRRAR